MGFLISYFYCYNSQYDPGNFEEGDRKGGRKGGF
jgi:hypothetical protein